MPNMIPRGSNPTELRRAFQWLRENTTGLLFGGGSGEVLVGAGSGSKPTWSTELTAITLLTVDNISINGAAITSDTGAISFGDENITTTGTISGVNVTSGESPGHTHDNRYYTETELDAGQLDNRYYTETEHINSSAGAGDAGKPVVLNADGDIDISMIPDGVGVTDHGELDGLSDDDHTIYILADGSRTLTGNLSVDALITIDGRDLSIDGAKLDGIEDGADVTDAANVASAGAAMAGGAFHDGFSDYVAAEHVSLPAALADIVSDTTATGANLTTLTDDSMADSLHRHSELSASDGSPNPALSINASGNMGWGTTSQEYPLDIRIPSGTQVAQIHLSYGDTDTGAYLHSLASGGFQLFGGATYNSTLGGWIAKGTAASAVVAQYGRVYYFGDSGLTPDSLFSPTQQMVLNSDGTCKIGSSGFGDARLEVETSSGEGRQAVSVDQNDADEAFIDFQGTSDASAANNISTWTGGAVVAGYTKQEINGSEYWMPYFSAPTGTSGELAELTTLTDNSMADSLHRHSELSASDGDPDGTLNIDSAGMVGLGTTSQSFPLDIRSERSGGGPQIHVANADVDYGGYMYSRVSTASGRSEFHVTSGMYLNDTGYWQPTSPNGAAMLFYGSDASIRFYGKTGMTVGVPVGSLNSTLQFWSASGNVSIGRHGSDPGARFTVMTETSEGHEAVAIDQNDADKAFIDFQGASAASAANNISTWVSGATISGFTRQEINGTERWMPYYTAPTGAALATEYVPDSVTLNTGSNTAGDVDSVAAMLDGDTYDVDEVASTPGFDMEFDFSGVTAVTGLRVRCLYGGSAGHTVELRLYNYNTTSWDTVLEFSDQAFQTILEFPILDDTNYIDGSGNAKVAIYHSSAGNAAHDISVDYVALTYGDEFSYPQGDHGNLNGLSDDDHTQYSLADGTRAFTGVVSGVTPTASANLATKGYVDDLVLPPFPAWDTNSDQWEDVKVSLSKRWSVGRAQVTKNYTTFGSAGAGTTKWFGGAVAGNGKIYCAPRNATTVLEIDPATDTIATFGSIAGSGKYTGIVLAPNGYLYCAPNDATVVLKVDPSGPSASTFGSVAAGSNKYRGCVLGNNGMIYCIPFNTSLVLKIDPTTDSVSTFGTVSGSYAGGVLAPNGYIYGIPHTASKILKIDPATDSEAEVGSVSESQSYIGGVLGPNGLIYCIPWDDTHILIIDTNTDTTRSITSGLSTSGDAYQAGCLGPDGAIWAAPFDNTQLMRIDPWSETIQQWGSVSGGNKWSGLVLAPNGCMYGVPVDSTTVLKLSNDIQDGVSEDWYLSRHFNKF